MIISIKSFSFISSSAVHHRCHPNVFVMLWNTYKVATHKFQQPELTGWTPQSHTAQTGWTTTTATSTRKQTHTRAHKNTCCVLSCAATMATRAYCCIISFDCLHYYYYYYCCYPRTHADKRTRAHTGIHAHTQGMQLAAPT